MTDERPIPDDITEEDLGFLHWWGPPTLYRCPLETDPANCDIALVGVPHSTGNGTTWRTSTWGHGRSATSRWRTSGCTWAGSSIRGTPAGSATSATCPSSTRW